MVTISAWPPIIGTVTNALVNTVVNRESGFLDSIKKEWPQSCFHSSRAMVTGKVSPEPWVFGGHKKGNRRSCRRRVTRQAVTGPVTAKRAVSRRASRTFFTPPECVKTVKVRRQVRTIGTRFGVRTVQVRTRGSHFWFAPANANSADDYQRGYHEKLPEQ